MSIDEIRAEVDRILALYAGYPIELGDEEYRGRADPEYAHGEEDALVELVVRSIADGSCPDHIAAVKELVRLFDAERTKWYS